MTALEPATEVWAAARWYTRQGIYVFPCHSVTPEGACTCRHADCSSVGKHPRTKNGVKDATVDIETVDRWWGMWPDANVAIAAGLSGWAVIDIDPDHGGDDSLHELEATHGKVPDTVRSITGGGGAHLVLQRPTEGFRPYVSIAPGIDTRGDDSYILAPPSNHKSGGTYVWEVDRRPGEFDLAPVPQWFIAEMEASRGSSRELDDSPGALIETGRREKVLVSLAGTMRSRGMTASEIYAAISAVNDERVQPPLATADLQRIASSVGKYAPDKGVFISDIEDLDPEEAESAIGGRVLIGEAMKRGVQPTNWLIENTLVRGRITTIYGEPESGKTIIVLSWMIQTIEMGLDVLFIDEESGIEAISALLLDMGADPDLVDKHIHYFPFPGIEEDGYEALLAYAHNLQPALVAFDSLTDMLAAAGLDENSGIEVTRWMLDVATALTRAPYQPSVSLVDHVPKDTENTRYSVASRAKKAKSDVLWFVSKNTDFDREHTARVELHRHKNRPGVLPKKLIYTIGGQEGTLICRPLDISQDGILAAPAGAEEFYKIIAKEGPKGRKEMEGRLNIGHTKAAELADFLIKADRLERVGYGASMRYQAIVRPDDTIVRADDSPIVRDIVRFVPPLGDERTIRKGADNRVIRSPYKEDSDETEKDWH